MRKPSTTSAGLKREVDKLTRRGREASRKGSQSEVCLLTTHRLAAAPAQSGRSGGRHADHRLSRERAAGPGPTARARRRGALQGHGRHGRLRSGARPDPRDDRVGKGAPRRRRCSRARATRAAKCCSRSATTAPRSPSSARRAGSRKRLDDFQGVAFADLRICESQNRPGADRRRARLVHRRPKGRSRRPA